MVAPRRGADHSSYPPEELGEPARRSLGRVVRTLIHVDHHQEASTNQVVKLISHVHLHGNISVIDGYFVSLAGALTRRSGAWPWRAISTSTWSIS
jgi:hypothetical protein